MDEEKKLALTVFFVYVFLLAMNIFNKQNPYPDKLVYYDENRIGNFMNKHSFKGYWNQDKDNKSVLTNQTGKMNIILYFGETDTDSNYKITKLHNQWVLYAKFYDPLYTDGNIIQIKQRLDIQMDKGKSIIFTDQKTKYNNFYYFNNLNLEKKIFCEVQVEIKLNDKVIYPEGISIKQFQTQKDLWSVNIKSTSKQKQCQLNINGTLEMISLSELNRKEFIYNLVSILIIATSLYGALKSIKKISLDNNYALKLNLQTIEMICLQHSFILFFNLQLGFTIINVFNYFYMYFWYVLLFCFIDQRILVYVWQLQLQHKYPEMSIQELKKKSCLYQLKFILLLVFYNYFMTRFLLSPLLLILNSLILIPQIIYNSKNQQIWVFDKEYLIFFISSAYLMFFYLRGFDNNIINLKPYFFEVTLGFVLLFFQLLILYGQDIYGSTFLVPKLISKQYDYFITLKQYRNIINTVEMKDMNSECETKEDSNEANSFFTQDNREDSKNCIICLEDLSIFIDTNDDLKNKNFKRILKKIKKDKIMCSPCNHAFHPTCLLKWMEIKMKCPHCRSELPNVIY